jgi:hypothetical protein
MARWRCVPWNGRPHAAVSSHRRYAPESRRQRDGGTLVNVRDSDLEAQPMAMWRIRINLADDPRSRARLNEVLARQQVSAIRLTPRAGTESELSGDVVLELPRDDELGDMLTALHTISPQVFVSRASQPAVEAGAAH